MMGVVRYIKFSKTHQEKDLGDRLTSVEEVESNTTIFIPVKTTNNASVKIDATASFITAGASSMLTSAQLQQSMVVDPWSSNMVVWYFNHY